MLQEVRQGLEKKHRDRVQSCQPANVKMTRPSAGTATKPGDLVLIKEADNIIH